jgi:hypothetical protein
MAPGGESAKPISLFYSYSHRDEDLRLKLQDHLAVLKWNGMIAEWNDRDIEAGAEWEREIDRHLSSADIILLLISASFIASKYCWSVEVKKALERHDRGEARVIPVILKPCRWQSTPFARLQATPKDAKPATAWSDLDTAFDDVVSKIEAVVLELQRKHAPSSVVDSPKPPPHKAQELRTAVSVEEDLQPAKTVPVAEYSQASPNSRRQPADTTASTAGPTSPASWKRVGRYLAAVVVAGGVLLGVVVLGGRQQLSVTKPSPEAPVSTSPALTEERPEQAKQQPMQQGAQITSSSQCG